MTTVRYPPLFAEFLKDIKGAQDHKPLLMCFHGQKRWGKSLMTSHIHELLANYLVGKRGFCECQNPTGNCCHEPGNCGWITFRRVGLLHPHYECHDCAEVNGRVKTDGLL